MEGKHEQIVKHESWCGALANFQFFFFKDQIFFFSFFKRFATIGMPFQSKGGKEKNANNETQMKIEF